MIAHRLQLRLATTPILVFVFVFVFVFLFAVLACVPETAEAQLFRRLRARRQAAAAARQTQPPVQPSRRSAPQQQAPTRQTFQPPANFQPANPSARYTPNTTAGRTNNPPLGANQRFGANPSLGNQGSGLVQPPASAGLPTLAPQPTSPTIAGSTGRSVLVAPSGSSTTNVPPTTVSPARSGSQTLNRQPLPGSPTPGSPTLGLDVASNVTPANFQPPNSSGRRGLVVAGIRPESLADDSGIRQGDAIVAIDNRQVYSASDIASALQSKTIGQRVRVQFLRGNRLYFTYVPLINETTNGSAVAGNSIAGNSVSVNSVAGQVPAKTNRPSAVQGTETSSAAATLPPITQQPATGYQASAPAARSNAGTTNQTQPAGVSNSIGMVLTNPPGLRGVVVQEVGNNTIANVSGIQSGDRIVSVDGRVVSNSAAFEQQVASAGTNQELEFGIVREGRLIQKSVDLSLDAAAVAKALQAQSEKPTSGLASGFGSVLGGLFGGSSKPAAAKPASKNAGKVEQASFNEPQAASSSEKVVPKKTSPETEKNESEKPEAPKPAHKDDLDFGDEETFGPSIFDQG